MGQSQLLSLCTIIQFCHPEKSMVRRVTYRGITYKPTNSYLLVALKPSDCHFSSTLGSGSLPCVHATPSYFAHRRLWTIQQPNMARCQDIHSHPQAPTYPPVAKNGVRRAVACTRLLTIQKRWLHHGILSLDSGKESKTSRGLVWIPN